MARDGLMREASKVERRRGEMDPEPVEGTGAETGPTLCRWKLWWGQSGAEGINVLLPRTSCPKEICTPSGFLKAKSKTALRKGCLWYPHISPLCPATLLLGNEGRYIRIRTAFWPYWRSDAPLPEVFENS